MSDEHAYQANPDHSAVGSRRTGLVVAVVLAALVLVLFWPTTGFELTDYDVQDQLTDNPYVRSLAPANLYRIFTRYTVNSYYPMRTLSFAIDYQLWGLDPRGYHLSNVLLHAVNVVLLFHLTRRLAGGRGGWRQISIGLATAAFAVHPVVVEPVTWVSGREELLALLFSLCGLHAHATARSVPAGIRNGRAFRWHVLTAVFGMLACMSNVVAVVLPALVTAYDLIVARPVRLRRILTGTWFLWLVAVGALVLKQIGTGRAVTRGVQDAAGGLPLAQRAMTVLHGYFLNVVTLAWPRRLTLLYPNVVGDSILAPGVLLGALLALLTLVVVVLARRRAAVLFGLAWFLIALAPSSQLVPHHIFRADRFLYLPLAGLSLAVAAVATCLADRRSAALRALPAVLVVILAALAIRARSQMLAWRDSRTLFEHCVAMNPASTVAHQNLGLALARQERFGEAMASLHKALDLEPEYPKAMVNLANCLVSLHRSSEAIPYYRRALAIDPHIFEARYNLGWVLLEEGRAGEAAEHLGEAVRLRPEDADARSLLRDALGRAGLPEQTP